MKERKVKEECYICNSFLIDENYKLFWISGTPYVLCGNPECEQILRKENQGQKIVKE